MMSLVLLSTNISSFEVPNIPKLKDLECLATNVYREARSESFSGQVAVTKVVLNRMKMKEYPKTACGVVFQPLQFSWTSNWKEVKYTLDNVNAVVAAYNSTEDFKATHYHVKTIKPSWSKRLKEGVTIGNHTFYLDK